jgi:hypothetical protein
MSTKEELIAKVLWDTNLGTKDVMPLLEDKVDQVSYLNKSAIFKRCLESYSWFTLLEIFSIEEVKQLLTKDLIAKLRSRALQKKYLFLYEYLQRTL